MPIIHRCAQRSDEWDRLRLGIPTSSNFDKIITPSRGNASEQWLTYANHLLAERCLGRRVDTYTSEHMERGAKVEDDARLWYEMDQGIDTEQIGFITTDDGLVGCSPDFLVGDDGLGEIKCPKPATMIEYSMGALIELLRHTGEDQDLLAFLVRFRNKTTAEKYRPQLQGQLYVSDRDWTHVIAWHEEINPLIAPIERDEKYIDKLEAELDRFSRYLDTVSARICPDWRERIGEHDPLSVRLGQRLGIAQLQDVDKRTPKETLRDQLRASLEREITP